MDVAPFVSVEEYLNTSYRPDRHYVDGELKERNGGERWHSEVQFTLALMIGLIARAMPIRGFTEQRVQITPTRFRVPDLCVVLGRHEPSAILRDPPFLCIEILSRGDGVSDVLEVVDDYRRISVPNIWIIDPLKRRAWTFSPSGLEQAPDNVLRTQDPVIEIRLDDVFAEIDRQ